MIFKKSTKYSLAFATILSAIALPAVAAAAPASNSARPSLLRGPAPFTLKYVALGDSVAAGLGLPQAANATAEDQACGRSPAAYSSAVAEGINDALGHTRLQLSATNVACQGAVVDNLSQPQTRGALNIQPQLTKAFAHGAPNLLTITMGANDAHWADFIGACFSAANCDTPANTAAAQAYLNTMQAKLSGALADIKARSHWLPPFVVVTGYYNPVSAACQSANVTTGEITWLTTETTAFNDALRTATEQSGWFARFAPVDFSGHDICSADSWIQRPGEPAPFHPTAQGQQVMAQAVLHSLGL